MPDFNRSVIHTFTMPGDTTNLYAMLDAKVYAGATAGLTPAQKAVVDAFIWTPTTAQIPLVPVWAGGDLAPIYFRTTAANMQAALSRYYR